MRIRLATRGSALALKQTELVKKKLEGLKDANGDDILVEIREVKTKGDLDRKSALTEIGGKGLFVRGIERELLSGRADIAVHSAKDLPYELAPGLAAEGIPEAADPRDVLITLKKENGQIPEHAVIGTGSPRRRKELGKLFPSAAFRENRGNIETRLRKLGEGRFDAIVLAKAGIDRLEPDMSAFDVRVLEPEECVPAGCQGILAVECRSEDREIRRLLAGISDPQTKERFRIERYVFQELEADCASAVGVYADLCGEKLTLTGMFLGKKRTISGCRRNWKEISDRLCRDLTET